MRLIDADAMIDFIDMGHLRNPLESCFSERDLVDMLESRPTIDAVPVVRCRECKHCDSTIFNGNFIGLCEIHKDSYGAELRVGLSDYCSDGERKEGDE